MVQLDDLILWTWKKSSHLLGHSLYLPPSVNWSAQYLVHVEQAVCVLLIGPQFRWWTLPSLLTLVLHYSDNRRERRRSGGSYR